jgi:hypothetical protein
MVKTVEVTGIRKNIMGTISIDMKIQGMRKPQDFIVYPLNSNSDRIMIQSSTRIALLSRDGKGLCSQSHPNGAYAPHLSIDKLIPFEFSRNDWRQIVEYIGITEGDAVGSSIVKTDNSAAKSHFGLD